MAIKEVKANTLGDLFNTWFDRTKEDVLIAKERMGIYVGNVIGVLIVIRRSVHVCLMIG